MPGSQTSFHSMGASPPTPNLAALERRVGSILYLPDLPKDIRKSTNNQISG